MLMGVYSNMNNNTAVTKTKKAAAKKTPATAKKAPTKAEIKAAETALRAEIESGRKKIVKDSLGEAEVVTVSEKTADTARALSAELDKLAPGAGAAVVVMPAPAAPAKPAKPAKEAAKPATKKATSKVSNATDELKIRLYGKGEFYFG